MKLHTQWFENYKFIYHTEIALVYVFLFVVRNNIVSKQKNIIGYTYWYSLNKMERNQSYYDVHNRYKYCTENEMLHLTCCSCT